MDTNPLIGQLILQFVLILLNAFFACAEIAVISINDAKLAKMASSGDKRAVRLARLTSQPARFLATIQVAITLAGFLGSAFAAGNFSALITDALLKAGVPLSPATLDTIAVVVITLILSYFTLVLGELVPKRIAMRKAEPLALAMSSVILFISKLFAPLVSLLTLSTNGVLRLLGIDPNAQDEEVTEEEIRMMIDVGGEKGAIAVAEQEMLQNVLEFNDISADELLTHRTKVEFLWLEETDANWDETIRTHRFSHFPVCSDTVDDIVGILDVKDYFRLTDKSRENVMKSAVSPAKFVPESIRADVLFREMQKSRDHFAVVLDEHGGVSGIITLNDLLEELVGDFANDDQPQEMPPIQKIGEDKWQMSGSAPLDEISLATGVLLPEDDCDTLGGLVFSELSAIPDDGSVFAVDACGLHIQVTEMKNHRVEQAVVTLSADQ